MAWNTEAALTPCWGFKRRIPVLRLLVLFFPVLGASVATSAGVWWGLAVPTVGYGLAHGLLGDWLYFRAVVRALTAADHASDPAARERALERVRVKDGPLHIAGSALLLAVGCWMIAAIGATHDAWSRARVHSVRSDLRNLVEAQDGFRQRYGRYAGDPAETVFAPSAGVRVRVLVADSAGFAAEGTRDDVAIRCEIFLGRVPGLRVATVEREPACVPTR